jgi:hypothetical protein
MLKTSRYDMAMLATTKYHGEEDGVQFLTEQYIHDCGNTSLLPESPEDILICYRDIIMIHCKVVDGWFNHRSGRSGLSVEYNLEKALVHFQLLKSLKAHKMVEFYDKLQKLSVRYLLPLMPFDTVKLSFNFEGLCPPRLGMLCYAKIGVALMEVLPCILPASILDVHSAITTVGFKSNNGYDLLWRVLELVVPGFNPTAPILPPIWHRDSNVFEFCQAHLLYFCLLAKKNNYYDAHMHTSIFLRAISTSEYADVVTLLQTQVDLYRNPDDKGFLPHHLWLNGNATLINNNAKARIWDFATPRIHQVDGADTDWEALDEEEHPFCHVQGYTPRALFLEQGRDSRDRDRGSNRGRPRMDRRVSTGLRDCGHTNARMDDRGSIGGRGGNAPQGRSLHRDQCHHPFMPNVICMACKWRSHPASSCNMLAIALFVERHKTQLSESKKSKIKEAWILRWKDKVGQPTRTPRQVMRAYCKDMDISANHLINAMDWDCWPVSEDDGIDNK